MKKIKEIIKCTLGLIFIYSTSIYMFIDIIETRF